MDRRSRLARARLYVVTGAREGRGDLPEFLEAILDAGVDVVQLREKESEAGDLLRWARTFREAADRHGALFFVNDRPDVALAAGALVGPNVLIGLSTHDRAQLQAAAPQADHVCVGPVYRTPTKPGRPATGLDLVRFAERFEPRPWFAIGGIDPETLPEVVEAGASRVVVVRAVTEAPDPAGAVRALLDALPAR